MQTVNFFVMRSGDHHNDDLTGIGWEQITLSAKEYLANTKPVVESFCSGHYHACQTAQLIGMVIKCDLNPKEELAFNFSRAVSVGPRFKEAFRLISKICNKKRCPYRS